MFSHLRICCPFCHSMTIIQIRRNVRTHTHSSTQNADKSWCFYEWLVKCTHARTFAHDSLSLVFVSIESSLKNVVVSFCIFRLMCCVYVRDGTMGVRMLTFDDAIFGAHTLTQKGHKAHNHNNKSNSHRYARTESHNQNMYWNSIQSQCGGLACVRSYLESKTHRFSEGILDSHSHPIAIAHLLIQFFVTWQ